MDICPGIPKLFPNVDFNASAVTTTGQGQVLNSRYLLPQDPFNYLHDDYGRSDFNTTHRVVIDYTYDVPAFSKLWGWPKWMDNWQLSGVFTAQSGQPFSIFAGPILGQITERAMVTGPVSVNDNPDGAISTTNLALPSSTSRCQFNNFFVNATSTFFPNTFKPSQSLPCIGNSPRNGFTGPGYTTMNFAFQKGFHVWGEGNMLIFRTEFYNLFNTSNFYNPVSTLSVDGFNTNPDFGKIKSAHDPRQIQFAVRFNW